MAGSPSFDRTDHTPAHRGDTVLPNSPFFSQLLRHGHYLRQPAIRDLNLGGLEKIYAELLSDVIRFKTVLQKHLPSHVLEQLRADKEEICIGVLAAGGYEYVVGVLAVLAIGAAVVPMTPALPVEEALYFVQKSRQVAIVSSKAASSLGRAIVERMDREGLPSAGHRSVQCVPVLPNLSDAAAVPPEAISISSDKCMASNMSSAIED